jgi:hypothetical protein
MVLLERAVVDAVECLFLLLHLDNGGCGGFIACGVYIFGSLAVGYFLVNFVG